MSGLRLVSDGAEYPNRERVGRYVTVLSDHGFDQRSATGVTEATCRLFPALAPPARPAGQARALLADHGTSALRGTPSLPRVTPGWLYIPTPPSMAPRTRRKPVGVAFKRCLSAPIRWHG